MRLVLVVAALAALSSGSAVAQPHPQQLGLPALPRADFNRLAAASALPLFWVADRNGNGLVEPDELAATGAGNPLGAYVAGGKLTPRFERDYRALVELRRREAVQRELDYARPTLVAADLRGLQPPEKALLKELLGAATLVEDLFLRQSGGARFAARVARLDAASRTLFWRNHGPWCQTPAAKGDPFCHGLPDFAARRSEAYPPDMVNDDAMCKLLQAQPNAKELLSPFTVVRRAGAGFAALPLTKAFGPQMKAVAARLRAAAGHVAKAPSEQALHRYLLAAARAFETNDWQPADEAWAAMNAQNSKWYLRVAADEVYFDPCQQKAGFHLSLARIDQASLEWQRKLTPLRSDMERAIAALIGKPYAARDVRFHLPDFIHVVLQAGDSRHPIGGTIGQSLPNWGKVADEGRGRTVVMSNLYTDPDSVKTSRQQAEALLSRESLAHYRDDFDMFLLNIILHEATHNFGPTSSFDLGGKQPKEVFSGGLASTLEEMKAQVGGLWYLQLLRKRGLIDDAQLKQAYTRAVLWSFGHISRGMFTPSGNVQPYSQLSAVFVGTCMQRGALSFKAGKFTIHYEKLPAAIEDLLKFTGRAKVSGDVAGARQGVARFVSGPDRALVHEADITAALQRFPKVSFVYSVAY
jgi:hypothetical protein